jgi:hypothetical protein
MITIKLNQIIIILKIKFLQFHIMINFQEIIRHINKINYFLISILMIVSLIDLIILNHILSRIRNLLKKKY